jgi:enamine deaminase RidA (YjgF/YER057c/UK114 family)
MTRRLISTGSKWEQEVGYSRVVVDGDWAFVSGTTGFDYATMTISPDIGEQTRQALENVSGALREAGFSLQDVVRIVYILPRAEDFHRCWPVLREYLGEIGPRTRLSSPPWWTHGCASRSRSRHDAARDRRRAWSEIAVAQHQARHCEHHERHRPDDRQRGDVRMERRRHDPGCDQPADDARAVADNPASFMPHVRATTGDAGNCRRPRGLGEVRRSTRRAGPPRRLARGSKWTLKRRWKRS